MKALTGTDMLKRNPLDISTYARVNTISQVFLNFSEESLRYVFCHVGMLE